MKLLVIISVLVLFQSVWVCAPDIFHALFKAFPPTISPLFETFLRVFSRFLCSNFCDMFFSLLFMICSCCDSVKNQTIEKNEMKYFQWYLLLSLAESGKHMTRCVFPVF